MSPKIKVVVVDDSALVRSLLTEIINQQPDMICVGTAADPLQAREVIRERNPDVITLDVEMPKMDGLEFLSRLMRLRPTPVVMVSTLTEQGAETTLRALELGAVDFVTKPRVGVASGLQQLADDIVDKIRIAARARVRRVAAAPGAAPPAPVAKPALSAAPPATSGIPRLSTEKVICIGASTGGTEAIKEILMELPPDAPAVVITQHMPPGFTASFAARLDSLCRIRVAEARDGERILPGHAYIAPGGKQFSLARSGANYIAVVDDSPPVNRHKPSVEVLFRSCARVLGPNAIGVMLTGMGADGAAAMKEMRDAGAYNIAQDEASCVVFGMPKMAIQAGAVHEVLPLKQIARAIMERVAAAGVRHRI
ncbi:chemotaxis response regulator protein-glutamate methylesterase [Tepidimonas taiwanensis]|uniref:Protein-glutamate methylesterase/protein-glutamine glutaminase n=1 Tax=Tepidimonas taiwanensis TaxID=307486 RepID=A0A554XBZ2_9BURK|nr:chemotaxis response regulator protein-glutamate methylesterase [Tepidimonas taiwanensis]MCX7693546.1 chemotaxis response regulator protein-glutamate methylesterase [Tepidimonas taiwanensis]MDM7464476.1 chemotaxis response regulator protein-glutamate methylesterase [Tepidimonas taiwanensis]TSE33360.1 Chemotaxis response regulator protein-glutamate methylesterase [Tepidimonas taiwanensis]UBQ04400.1 chemotaxis response regulator protein-glutamate methylesterase [Tepidimonas taiwanensis]